MRQIAFVALLCAGCSSASSDEASCTDGVANGDETDVDCGGPCQPCGDGSACVAATDCASGVCATMCQAPSCTDGVQNGGEGGVDCNGPCPPTYAGIGCVTGTAGSQVCTSYTGGSTFQVTITWNAAGGNAYVDYATAYGSQGENYNSMGIVGGGPVNICTTGPMSVSFSLPLGNGYTYKVWHAYCVRTDACSGCGDDYTTAEGGPFGVYQSC